MITWLAQLRVTVRTSHGRNPCVATHPYSPAADHGDSSPVRRDTVSDTAATASRSVAGGRLRLLTADAGGEQLANEVQRLLLGESSADVGPEQLVDHGGANHQRRQRIFRLAAGFVVAAH